MLSYCIDRPVPPSSRLSSRSSRKIYNDYAQRSSTVMIGKKANFSLEANAYLSENELF
jgi:hypothetical protein